ncbi:hypothetical protein RB596_004967 [Gaeumannomyces avenae]
MNLLRRARDAATLKADESRHEETTSWVNRDLVPLPPSRRTWGWFNFFGAQSLGALNISSWQLPNAFLTQGLSVGQAMAIVVVSRLIVSAFACVVGWCGLTWHVGFTVQNRFTWGMRGSYIPLLQRSLLNFIWTALQCWNGGKLVTVALTALWPSFHNLPNTLPESVPTTTSEMVGFAVFWILSVPFLFIRPERFKKPFFVSSLGCGVGMICMMIWALAAAGGVGPVFYKCVDVPASSRWSVSWLIMAGLNQAIGGVAAGIANESDFSRYSNSALGFVLGTVSVQWVVGILVALGGLVTTAACQVLYGKIYWNPPDLMLVIIDNGNGSPGSRAGVFFLALAFTFAILFQNVCGNAVAGGIDLAGVFPRYVDIRRGAIITFVAAWVLQPCVMICDYFFVRRQRVKLSHLYRPRGSDYWFTHGFNPRVIPCWVAGWIPTIGGLVATVGGYPNAPDALFQLYYAAFFIGLSISFTLFLIVNMLFPPPGSGEFDPYDDWATFTPKEAARLGIVPNENAEELVHTRLGQSGYDKSRRQAVAANKEMHPEAVGTVSVPMEVPEKVADK